MCPRPKPLQILNALHLRRPDVKVESEPMGRAAAAERLA